MKSAYELAMERLGGGEIRQYTEEQKAAMGELDKLYQAKIAQARFDADRRLKEAFGNMELTEQILADLPVELASFEQKCEKEKEKIRNGEK